jgi:hypothetical protein
VRRDEQRLRDILDAIDRIERAATRGRAAFDADESLEISPPMARSCVAGAPRGGCATSAAIRRGGGGGANRRARVDLQGLEGTSLTWVLLGLAGF